MKTLKNYIFLLGLLVCIPLFYSAQDKNTDKIEMLYDQGNFNRVYKKTSRFLKTDEYKQNAPMLLFNALAEYQLKHKSKYSEKTALNTFKKYISIDVNREYTTTYGNYIYDLQLGLVNAIRDLEKANKTDLAKSKFNEYSQLFDNSISFEEMTATKPKIAIEKVKLEEDKIETEEKEEKPLANNSATKVKTKKVIKEAKKHIGTPYKYGGMTPKGFDCSGFTQYVMAKNNVQIPRTASAQSKFSKKIKQKNAKVGDFAFFGSSKNKISHVGIISKVEGDKIFMIHASSSKGVMISEITTNVYWGKRLQLITRITK